MISVFSVKKILSFIHHTGCPRKMSFSEKKACGIQTQPKNFPFKCRKLLVLSYRLFQKNAFSEKESFLTKGCLFLEHPMVCSINEV